MSQALGRVRWIVDFDVIRGVQAPLFEPRGETAEDAPEWMPFRKVGSVEAHKVS